MEGRRTVEVESEGERERHETNRQREGGGRPEGQVLRAQGRLLISTSRMKKKCFLEKSAHVVFVPLCWAISLCEGFHQCSKSRSVGIWSVASRRLSTCLVNISWMDG